jgi:uncharacterized membrane protein
MYLLIIITGLSLAFYTDISIKNIEKDSKNTIFMTAVTLVVLYALVLFILTITRFYSYVSQAVDIFFFHQVVWQFAEFKLPYIWQLSQPLYPQWSQHFSPILMFLAPIYWVYPNAVMLMITQALAAITGAIPIYLIARNYLKSRFIGIALSFAYLVFSGLQYGFDYGFHEIMFFPVLFLWSYYFYLKKNTKLYIFFIILSLFVKEEVAFIVFFWGLYLLIFRRDKIWGSVTTALGIFWYIVCFDFVFPTFNQGQGFGYWGQYQMKGGTGLFGIAMAAFSNPIQFLQSLVTPDDKIKMMLETFGQFAFLFLLFPPSLIIIFPSLMEKLLSTGIAMSSGAHYSAAITAAVVVATLEALPHIYKYKFVNKFVHYKNAFFAVLIFYIAYSSSVFYGYIGFTPINLFQQNPFENGLTPDNSIILNQILSNLNTLPKNTTVSTQAQILPHIPFYYKRLSSWPGMTGTEDLVIVDTQIYPVGANIIQDEAEYSNDLLRLSKNKNYQPIVAQSGIYVFRKKIIQYR